MDKTEKLRQQIALQQDRIDQSRRRLQDIEAETEARKAEINEARGIIAGLEFAIATIGEKGDVDAEPPPPGQGKKGEIVPPKDGDKAH